MTDRLDDAIDRAVRDMLDVEPRADLRARVIAQLAGPRFRLPAIPVRLVASVAAAAVILFAVFVVRRTAPVAPPAPVVARTGDLLLAAETRRGAPAKPAPSDATMPPVPASVRVGPRAPQMGRDVVAFDTVENQTTAIEPLQSIAPIAIAPIAQDSIAPAEIAMHSLDPISEVQIAPLTPPDRRK